MEILRAYKTKVILNNAERTYLEMCAKLARQVFNWGLNAKEAHYADQLETLPEGEKPKSVSGRAVKKAFNAQKDSLPDWFLPPRQFPYTILAQEFDNLQFAFDSYWRKKKDGTVARDIARLQSRGKWDRRLARMLKKGRKGIQLDPGYPRFKSWRGKQSFSVRGAIKVQDGRVRLPSPQDKTLVNRLRVGPWFRLAEGDYLPETAEILSTTISREGGDWYISFQVRENVPEPEPAGDTVLGVDVGIHCLAATSDGTIYENPRTLAKYDKKLKRLQKQLSRQQEKSRNWHKTKQKIADLHRRITRVRRHVQHNISRDLVANKRPGVIVLEDLNVKGMMAAPVPKPNEDGNGYGRNNRRAKAGLSRNLSDAGMAELRRQIGYKADWAGVEVVLADRWFASSKTCSACGCIKEDLKLSDRTFRCAHCGFEIDRDVNAARNLAAYIGTREARGIACGAGRLRPL